MKVVDDDVVPFVDGDAQVGDPLDRVADDVKVITTMILGTSEKYCIWFYKNISIVKINYKDKI